MSGYIFATKAHIDNRKKLLSITMSSRCPYSMVNFGPLAAEIDCRVWGTIIFQRVSRLGSVTARQSSSGCQPNFAALNRGRHLCSAGRPSRWALAHILVFLANVNSRSRSLYAIARPSVCLSVCNTRAPYSGGLNFPQYFYGIWYHGHPLTSAENFTEIVRGEPLRRGS